MANTDNSIENLDTGRTADDLNKVRQQLKNLSSELKTSGESALLWSDKLRKGPGSLKSWTGAFSGVTKTADCFKKMADAVYETDTAMTELYRVTDKTDTRYNRFLSDALNNAERLGSSVSSLIKQTAAWAELGFSLDQAEELAKTSSIYSNISGTDNATSVSGLAAAVKAFNIQAEDSIAIVDSLSKLGKEFSATGSDLGEGLKNSAASMSAAGADMNETLAMLTAGAGITDSAEEFGNFLNTSALRIMGMKNELPALGEEVSTSADSVSKVQTQVMKLTDNKVSILDDSSNIRNYYEIMKDISEIYSDLSSADQASLDGILFGKQNLSYGSALIQAFESGQVQKALEASLDSAGYAMKEQERWLESLEAKTTQFKAAFQSLSETVLDSDLLKWFVDLGTGAVSAFDAVIDKFGGLSTILGAGSGIALNKMLG